MWFKYGKSFAAAAVLIVTAIQAAISDSATGGRITEVEAVQVAIAVVIAGTVYLAPNLPDWPYIKTLLAALLASLQLAVTLVVDGIGSADWTALILAALTVLVVGFSPAQSAGTVARAPLHDRD